MQQYTSFQREEKKNMHENNMACPLFNDVLYASVNEDGQFAAQFNHTVSVKIDKTGDGAKISAMKGELWTL